MDSKQEQLWIVRNPDGTYWNDLAHVSGRVGLYTDTDIKFKAYRATRDEVEKELDYFCEGFCEGFSDYTFIPYYPHKDNQEVCSWL